MTIPSLILALLAAFLVGLLGGYRRQGTVVGSPQVVALAAACGLLLLQCSSPVDLLRAIRPSTALDWLPALCLCAAVCSSIRPGPLRTGLSLALAGSMPVCLLWGSIFDPLQNPGLPLTGAASLWAVSLLVVLITTHSAQPHKLLSGTTLIQGCVLAGVALLLTMTGSLVYGAAAGVCAVAALGALLSTHSVPAQAVVPLIALAGLGTAFSELPVTVAAILLLSLVLLATSERWASGAFHVSSRAAALAAVVLAAALVVPDFLQDINGDSSSAAADHASTSLLDDLPPLTSTPVPTAAESTTEPDTDASLSPGVTTDADDPFGGFGFE